jgi:predicted DsbA family dithiol-disulfide isomerase
MDAETYRPQIQATLAEAERRGVNQTPTFVIGDKLVPGAIPYDTFRKLVDDELAKTPVRADTGAGFKPLGDTVATKAGAK